MGAMGFTLSSQRVLRTAATGLRAPRPSACTPNTRQSLGFSAPGLYSAGFSVPQRRSISWGRLWNKKKDGNQDGLARKDIEAAKSRQALIDRLSASQVSRGSIFADEFAEGGQSDGTSLSRRGSSSVLGGSLAKEHIARVVDPDPRSRVRWQRKMVIRRVHRNLSVHGQETKAEKLARTERRVLSKSPALPTSVKKLMHLARQVSGKTVEDALVQMRFSKKKMAREVRAQLETARKAAVVERGMGLGRVNGEVFPEGEEAKIQTKDGRWLTVDDPTRLYVEQAWVGRGSIREVKPIYAARGRVFKSISPSTYLSLVIKEEKTRIREHQEREAKKARRAPWLHLPDRPVTSQRQYYSW